MDKHRQIAFILAFILALLIMMVGKACTDSAMKKQNKNISSGIQQSTSANGYNNYNNNYNNSYNNASPQITTTVPVQTEPPVVYVTNMLGEIVGTEMPETVTEIQTTTEKFSILEEYNAGKQKNNTPAENNNYQPPSEIHITIH